MIKYSKRSPRSKKEIAQTMVEFAIVFPVLLVITYGIIEFGRMLFIYTATTSAAREGARFGATAYNYKNCEDIRNAARKTALLISPSSILIDIEFIQKTPSTYPPTCGASYSGDNLILGDSIKVIVTTHYAPVIPFLGLSGTNIVRQSTRIILLDVAIDHH